MSYVSKRVEVVIVLGLLVALLVVGYYALIVVAFVMLLTAETLLEAVKYAGTLLALVLLGQVTIRVKGPCE